MPSVVTAPVVLVLGGRVNWIFLLVLVKYTHVPTASGSRGMEVGISLVPQPFWMTDT